VGTLLRAVAALKRRGTDLECAVVGDGPERPSLEALSRQLGIADHVCFDGALSHDDVLSRYEWADVLVLASETEGWPKALAEGMAFGLSCVGSNRGMIPWMLADGRGLVVPAGDVEGLTQRLQDMASNDAAVVSMGEAASAWAQRFTLDGFRRSLQEVLGTQWIPRSPVGRIGNQRA